jgi:polyphosphate glucokinase
MRFALFPRCPLAIPPKGWPRQTWDFTSEEVTMEVLGLDIGGSGIKAAPVNTETGIVTAERFRLPTPQPATPEAMVATAAEVIRQFNWKGPVGVGFPAVVKRGVVMTASNIDKSWIGQDAQDLIGRATGCPVVVGNDADVASLAEVRFGAGRGLDGLLIVITIGTGIGTGIVFKGKLIPNTELGHMHLANGLTAEQYAAEPAKKRDGLKSKEWGARLNMYLKDLEFLFSPDLFILGGGGSKKFEKFEESFTLKTKVVPAELRNMAGIIGAALMVEQ